MGRVERGKLGLCQRKSDGEKKGDCIDVLSLLKMLDGLDEQENMRGQGKCMHV